MSEHEQQTTPDTDETLAYTLWAVFRRSPDATATPSAAATNELADVIASLPGSNVTLRGIYDVSGFRADADLMVWVHGSSAESLQCAYRRLRGTELFRTLLPQWNAMGVHRDAEFTRDHRPAFMRGLEPRNWVVVYPFVRSYEWYILPADERRQMLAEHGRLGAGFKTVLTHTVAAFGLGDYEWILPLEANELIDIVDVIRALRATNARLHVREEVPFFTGRRIDVADVAGLLSK